MNISKTRTIKEMVENNQKVRFRFYRNGQLWYGTECDYKFPVPISEAGTAVFLAKDKAIPLMRYIRRCLEFLKKSMDQKGSFEFDNGPSTS
jgi:hypothetical protein